MTFRRQSGLQHFRSSSAKVGLLAVLRKQLRGQHRDVGVDMAALREVGQQFADVIGQPGMGKRRFQYAPDNGPVLRGVCFVGLA